MRNKAICRDFESVAFLGFQKPNIVTEYVSSTMVGRPINNYYDLELNAWDVNSNWFLNRKYDLIVCLRCPYFAHDPVAFLRRCNDFLNDRGSVFIDYGLGDHWRFEKFRAGWVDDIEREYCLYAHTKQHLWSAYWDDKIKDSDEFNKFCELSSEYYGLNVKEEWNNIIRSEIGPTHLLNDEKINDVFVLKDVEPFLVATQRPQLYTFLWMQKYP